MTMVAANNTSFTKYHLRKIMEHLGVIRELSNNLRSLCGYRAPNLKKWATISAEELEGIKQTDLELFRLLMGAEIAMQRVLDHVHRKNEARRVRR